MNSTKADFPIEIPSPSQHDASEHANTEQMQTLSDGYQQQRPKWRTAVILIALYLSIFIAAIDQTIMATSIPTIASQLHSASGYFWIGGAYFLANAAAGPIWAKMSDIWGRKPVLLSSVVLFAIASIFAALSQNMRMLIAARALQGVAGGGLIQLVIITVSDLFSMRERTLYFMFLEVIWALAGGTGPLLGGAFTQLLSWRWNFWVNLPVCAAAFVLLLIFLDVHNPRTRIVDGLKAIDWLGTASILGVTLMLLLGLDFGGAVFPWNSPTVICLIISGALMVGIFLFCEKRLATDPLVPLNVFNHRTTNAAIAVCFAHGIVFMGCTYYLPLYLQAVKRATPLRSGVYILANVLPEASTGAVVGLFMHSTGRYREPIWIGTALLTLGTGLYIMLTPSSYVATIIGFEIIEGIGSGFLFQAPLVAVQAMASQADTAAATATFGFIREVGAVISVVIGGVVFQNGMNAQMSQLQDSGLDADIVSALTGGHAAANVDIVQTLSNAKQRRMVEEVFSLSLKNMFIMYTCIAGVALICSAFIVHRNLSTEHLETKTGIGRRAGEVTPAQT